MPCKPCIEKWTEYYQSKGFTEQKARSMARKVVKRVEKRLKMSLRIRIRNFLRRWIFETNWRATLYWFRWIGKGFNPDYTQTCICIGYCYTGDVCIEDGDCRGCGKSCPDPLPNSHFVNDNCVCGFYRIINCKCKIPRGCSEGRVDCSVSAGSCRYDCDEGYYWNGTACVPESVPEKVQYSNGLISVSVS